MPDLEHALSAGSCPRPGGRRIVSLLAYAGRRPEEIVGLRRRSVGGVLVIDEPFTASELQATKTGKLGTVEVVGPLGRGPRPPPARERPAPLPGRRRRARRLPQLPELASARLERWTQQPLRVITWGSQRVPAS